MSLSENATDRNIELRVGDRLEAILDSNPSTGFQWEVESIDKVIIKRVGKPEYKPKTKDTNLVGSGGKMIFHFEMVAPGKTVLKLIYHRLWEKGIPPIKTFEVTVIVK